MENPARCGGFFVPGTPGIAVIWEDAERIRNMSSARHAESDWLLSKFAIVEGARGFGSGRLAVCRDFLVRRATQLIRATARISGSSLEGDSRWLKAP
jgi:hypothetical protein